MPQGAVTNIVPSTTTGVASTPRIEFERIGPGQAEFGDVVGGDAG